jgi:MFS family permease
MLVAGRMIGGIGVGTLALGAPLYISEVAPPNLRGSLLVLETFSIVIGAIIAYWMTYGTSEIQSDWAWRLPFLLQMIPALMVGFGIHLFPFSPRWLVMRNRNDESLQSLCRLRSVPADDERVQIEWKGIIADVRLEREVLRRRHGESSGVALEFKIWYDLFTRYRSRTFVAVGVMFFQQVCFFPILSVRWLLTKYKVLRNKCLRLLRSDTLHGSRPG